MSTPEPQGPNEHFLYLSVIMLVPAIIVVGGFAAWMVFTALGIDFPEQARFLIVGCLTFLFGGGIAATVKK